MQTWPLDIKIIRTADGSPSLAMERADGYVEKMHHSGGALSESLYIYHQALLEVLNRNVQVNVFSLGLGAGYNELITVGEMLKRGLEQWKIWSFEARMELRESFVEWIQGSLDSNEKRAFYEEVLSQVAQGLEIEKEDLRRKTKLCINDGHLEIRQSYPDDIGSMSEVSLIYFDAFSKKMESSLWDEHSIEEILSPRLQKCCVLATYAATGSLNRALKNLGFRLLDKRGFLGKRECTLAIRE